MKFITKYSEFMLNETLKTHEINDTIKFVSDSLSLQHYNFNINKDNNKILITLNNVSTTNNFQLSIENLNSLLIDRHGWFPSKMRITNLSNNENLLKYDLNYILDNYRYFNKIELTYEPKFDIISNVPKKLYHLTFNSYINKILKNGLIPKTKNRQTKHLDRIYLCKTKEDCLKLINQMKFHEIQLKRNFNVKWILLEIDTTSLEKFKIYQDPNYNVGYYTIDNIPPQNIKIIDQET